jgi:hypothetical protein
MYGSMNLRPAALKNWNGESEEPARRRIRAMLEPVWGEAWELWRGEIFPAIQAGLETAPKSKFSNALREFLETWKDRARTADAEGEFFISLINGALSSLPSKNKLKDIISEHTGGAKDWRDARKTLAELSASVLSEPPYGPDEARTRDMLCGCAALFWNRWDEARRVRGVL